MTLTADGSWMMERGLLDGKFHFKKLWDGSVDKTKAVCTDCQAEFSYHQSTSSLNYHMQAKLAAAATLKALAVAAAVFAPLQRHHFSRVKVRLC